MDTLFPVNAVAGAPAYSGRMLRQAGSVALAGATAARPLGARSGVRPGTSTATVTATSTTWSCGPFAGVIDAQAAAEAGPYQFAFDAAATGAVTAANASNPRVDIIYVQVDDPAESDGTSVPAVRRAYLAGTAAATPSAPAAPARSFVIAQINVPKAGGGAPTVSWVAPYAVAAGGILPVDTLANLNLIPGVPGQHAVVFADPTSANNGDYVWNGSGWTPPGHTVGAILSRNTNTFNVATGIATQVTDTYLDTTKAVGVTVSAGAVTIVTPGDYWVSASVQFLANATGIRQIQLNRNSLTSSTNLLLSTTAGGFTGSPTTLATRRLVTLAAGDVLRFWIAQNSGGSLAVAPFAGDLPATFFEVVWAGA